VGYKADNAYNERDEREALDSGPFGV